METVKIATKFSRRAIVPSEVLGNARSLKNFCETSDGVSCVVTVVKTSWVHDDFMRKLLDFECREVYNMPFSVVESAWKKRLGAERIEYWDELKMERQHEI